MSRDQLFVAIKKIIPKRIYANLQPLYHFGLAFLAALFYGFPARKMIVVGVTGTKGKTTVVELLHAILAAAGRKTASLSSLRFKIGEKEFINDLKMTMPGRFFVQKFLHQAGQAGCKYAIIEVTSEGIKQFRHRFIGFDLAVMTNMAPEHLESHGSFEKYLRAKLDLFWRLPQQGTAIINKDDYQAKRFLAATGAHKVFYGEDGILISGKNFILKNLELEEGITFDLNNYQINSLLTGKFNLYNILAAIAAGLALHIPLVKIAEAVVKVSGIPGRMEIIQKNPFKVIVDYAHTPDSLRQAYETLKNSRLICVLGSAGGGRDKWKRPEMGKIAAEFCQEIIITNEDPYDEDPQKIINEVASEISQKAQVINILDRREAIRKALQRAQPNDTVIITGKGAEPWLMGAGGKKIPWDDREVAREELKQIKK
ncbi:MAG: UDP-N-acetylmuramoyl-L-alanyl-D-glutamate--2,6-diaminopimelate ligase [Candidatus Nealsonbacteria bacterium]|nr:UDP-N-acetylmuramoyl-L-alanyl-D-glutamate--2,6-diaminopimelate ligase [Candidatus Nealsonbacteria bacterium]